MQTWISANGVAVRNMILHLSAIKSIIILKECGTAAPQMVGKQGIVSFIHLPMNEIYYSEKMRTRSSANGAAIENRILHTSSCE